MIKKVYLDCDGTWINLYGVEGWRSYLQNNDTYPYEVAKPLVNLSLLARTIHLLQRNGFSIGIISWTSKSGDVAYHEAIKKAKMRWLQKHIPSVIWDEIHIVPYGTPKSSCGCGILFDDEERNRLEWGEGAYDEKNLIANLRNLLTL